MERSGQDILELQPEYLREAFEEGFRQSGLALLFEEVRSQYRKEFDAKEEERRVVCFDKHHLLMIA